VALVALGRGAKIIINDDDFISFLTPNGDIYIDNAVCTASRDVRDWLGYEYFSEYLSALEKLGENIFKRAGKVK
jgi:hypothetical protein